MMRNPHWVSVRAGPILLGAFMTVLAVGSALAGQESSIFTFDGKDFIRQHTTLLTEDGKSAVNTKLDQNSPAYKALIKKHSYTGDVTVFGRHCGTGIYAPVINAEGKMTGALFVCTD